MLPSPRAWLTRCKRYRALTLLFDGISAPNLFAAFIRPSLPSAALDSIPFFFSSRRRHTRWPRDWSSDVCSSDLPQIKAGNLKVLAIYADERSPDLPDTPTLKELGVDVVNGSSRGYSAPKGIPEQALEEMIAALDRVIDNPKFQEDAKNHALPIDYKSGDDYGAFLKKQEEDFGEIWDEIKDEYNNEDK